VARVPLAKMGEPSSSWVQLSEGTELTFVMGAERYKAKSNIELGGEVELLRGGTQVAVTRDCPRMDVKGSTSGSLWLHDRNCKLTVPPGGADAVRAKMFLTKGGARATFEDLFVEVRTH
jgi:hypothetical protein